MADCVAANVVATESAGAQVALRETIAYVVGAKGLASYDISVRVPSLLDHLETPEVSETSCPDAGVTIASAKDLERVYVAGGAFIVGVDVSDPKDLRKVARV